MSGLTLNNRRTTKEMIFLHQDGEDSDRSKCFFLLCLVILCSVSFLTILLSSVPYLFAHHYDYLQCIILLFPAVLCFFFQLYYTSLPRTKLLCPAVLYFCICVILLCPVLCFFTLHYTSLPSTMFLCPAVLYFFAQLHCRERVKRARSVSVTQKRST